ncbi:substrate-binding domain-containing protein [Truepera radiovictrix]|uniref:ABC ribose transporter, periplasmic solute-binding protein n=1 Tax=Truepera radiovictrix (strain DSM 17093 / CIP 108686 / LMG 22925 / RQ-24) TaxID=649638 RepID=D7CTH3_TRURR|nr:substrate-binding domain-containing protein [Truepera radiovictrix]ADI13830.1 ABC ribose transporter, periplasmic solute-binding protein [Truepera radiovictrix DSM 17093]WMT57605.1 substrate-binding domain-containing protein [Truepera radiovictrix]
MKHATHKRRLALLGLLLALPLAGAQDEPERVTIGVSIPAATHGWTGGVNYWAEQAARRLQETYPNLTFVINTAADPSEQANDLQDLLAIHQIDALVVLPFESDPLTQPVAQVKEQGVFITVVDRGLADPSIQDLYVAGDNEAFGRVAGEYFVENLEPGDNIVILRGLPVVIDTQRVDAFNAALEGSGINVLDARHGNWNRDTAFEVMQDFLTRFPDIDAVWASDDDMLEGVLAAVEQAGRAEQIKFIVGGAGKKEVIQRVMEGDELVPVNVTYPPSMIATAMEVTALNYVGGGVPIVGEYLLTSELVTQENAEQFYFPDSPF